MVSSEAMGLCLFSGSISKRRLDMNLPKTFIHAVSKYGISGEDIVFAACGDFDMDYRFADSIAALTKTKLVFAVYPYQEKTEYRLGGYGSFEFAAHEEPTLRIYNLEQLEALEVLRQISSGLLLARIEGADRDLCHFSNTHMASLDRKSVV